MTKRAKNVARLLAVAAGVWVGTLVVLAAASCGGPKPTPNYPPGAETCATACAHVTYDLAECGLSNELCNRICTSVAANYPGYAECLALANSCSALNACDPQ